MFPTTSDIINKDLEKRSNKNKISLLDPDFDPNNFQMPSISEDRPAVILDYNKKNDQVKVGYMEPLVNDNDLVETWLKTQPNPVEVHSQYDYDFIKKQLQNYLNPGSAEENAPAAGSESSTPESSGSPQKTDFTLETATAGNKDTVSKFDDLFNE